jgi:hypothetical protein
MHKFIVYFQYLTPDGKSTELSGEMGIIAQDEDEARRNVQTHLDTRKINAKVIWVQEVKE